MKTLNSNIEIRSTKQIQNPNDINSKPYIVLFKILGFLSFVFVSNFVLRASYFLSVPRYFNFEFKIFCFLSSVSCLLYSVSPSIALVESNNTKQSQQNIEHLPVGERIAYWAEKFVGHEYDTDPLGEYVRKSVIVNDEHVDCMYHIFRSVELASGDSPEDSITLALQKRFKTKGILNIEGKVVNYEDRFQYGIDMIDSNKWGNDTTGTIGKTITIKGERGREKVEILPVSSIYNGISNLRSGDIVFFIKKIDRRVVSEIVGHLGILKREGDEVFLIHASGRKDMSRGKYFVKKQSLKKYIASMPFIGIKVTRFIPAEQE